MKNKINKHQIKKLEERKGFNNSFLTPANMKWYCYIVNWLPDPLKPLVFLPCGRGEKTRKKYCKKKISESMTHNFFKAIRENNWFEKVILSEPLTIIPYEKEMHPLRPDYNLPAKDLSIQSERIFINQLALWLLRVKMNQSNREYVYYCGSLHHFFILHFANLIANSFCPGVIVIPINLLFGYLFAKYIDVPPTPHPASKICSTYHLVASSLPTGR